MATEKVKRLIAEVRGFLDEAEERLELIAAEHVVIKANVVPNNHRAWDNIDPTNKGKLSKCGIVEACRYTYPHIVLQIMEEL